MYCCFGLVQLVCFSLFGYFIGYFLITNVIQSQFSEVRVTEKCCSKGLCPSTPVLLPVKRNLMSELLEISGVASAFAPSSLILLFSNTKHLRIILFSHFRNISCSRVSFDCSVCSCSGSKRVFRCLEGRKSCTPACGVVVRFFG